MSNSLTLLERTRKAMVEAGFLPDFPAGIRAEINTAASNQPNAPADLRHLLWSSIDNPESRDLDQVEYAEPGERGAIRLLLGIADVARFVPQRGVIDQRAFNNTVSLYTAPKTFHLLPEELSTERTSLLEGEDRHAAIIEMLISADGSVENAKVYRALLRNRVRLTYQGMAAYIQEGRRRLPRLDEVPGLEDQLRLQIEAAKRLATLRKRMGALTFSDSEPKPIRRDGEVVDLTVESHNQARDIIECFMIAANVAAATFLKSRGCPIIERVVRAPRRWDRIRLIASNYGFPLPDSPAPKPLADFLALQREQAPESFPDLSLTILKLLGPGEYVVEYPDGPQSGHFGLALDDYSHSTAPNRRYSDLVLQRVIFASLSGEPIPYSRQELESIARQCTEREDAARKIERLSRKIAAALLVRERVGETFDAIVTGASPKGTYVRLRRPSVEGKVIQGGSGFDVGDPVRVTLRSVDADRGFIDFAEA